MKKIISCLILCAMLLTLFPMSVFAVTTSTYSAAETGWYSPDQTEYTILTANQLAGFNQLMTESSNFASTDTKQYKVTLAEGVTFDLTGYEWMQGTVFNGTFDGNGCTIKNMTIKISANVAGMFSYAAGTIEDFTLENVTASNSSYGQLGAVVGSRHHSNTGATALLIDGITVTGATIEGNTNLGGIIGSANNFKDGSDNQALTIQNCSFNGTVTGTSKNVGGIVGYGVNCSKITVDNCQVNATVSGKAARIGGVIGYTTVTTEIKNNTSVSGSVSTANMQVGGAVGLLDTAGSLTITDCQISAAVSATNSIAGGVVGCTKIPTEITKTVVSGSVTSGKERAGGVVGVAVSTAKLTVKDCIVTADVKSDATGNSATNACAGGIVGESQVTTDIINCSVAANIGGTTNGKYIGGFVGYFTAEATLKIEKASFVGNVDNKSHGGGGLIGFLDGGATADIDDCVVNASFSGAGNMKGGLIGRSLAANGKPITINIDNCLVTGSMNVPNGCTYAAGIIAWVNENNNYVTNITCNNVIVAMKDITYGTNFTAPVFNAFVGTINKNPSTSYTFTNLYYDSTLMTSEKIAGQFNFDVDNTDNKAWSAKSTDELKSLSLTGWSTVKNGYPIPSALNGTATYGHQDSGVADDKIDYRIVGALNTEDLASVKDIGFYVTVTNGENTISQKVSCKEVFSCVIGGGITYNKGTGTDTDTVEYIGGDYLYVLVFKDYLSASTFTAKLTSYSTDMEGNETFGVTKVITLKPTVAS